MARIEREEIALKDDDGGQLGAVWSRSGRHLLINLWDHKGRAVGYVSLRTDQVEKLARFIKETLPSAK